MFRFLMMLILMTLSFMVGKISALEVPDFEVIYEKPASEISIQEILALVRNNHLKSQLPDLHRILMAFLATPQIQDQLINPDRYESAVYQELVNLVELINAQLS